MWMFMFLSLYATVLGRITLTTLRVSVYVNIFIHLYYVLRAFVKGRGLVSRRSANRSPTRSGRERRSQPRSWIDSSASSTTASTWRRSGASRWPPSCSWTSRRSRSGSRTSARKWRRRAACETNWRCSWWRKDSTITRRLFITERTLSAARLSVSMSMSMSIIIIIIIIIIMWLYMLSVKTP